MLKLLWIKITRRRVPNRLHSTCDRNC